MRVFFKCMTFVFSFIFFLVSCSEEKEPVKEETDLEIFNKLDIFDATEGAQTIAFTAPTVWVAQTDQSWCSVTPEKGNAGMNTITVTVQPTSDYVERNASLLILSGSKRESLTITQKQKDALLLTSSKKEMTAEGGIIEVEVQSNVDFSHSIDANAVEWIVPIAERSLNTRTLRFKVKSNDKETKREGIIVFSSGNLREEFHVYQQGTTPQLILTQNVYTVSDQGENIKVELQSNFDYEVKMPEVDWVKQMGTRSLSTYTHYFTISPNKSYENRTAKIEFVQKDTGLSEFVTINQSQKSDILIGKTEYEFEANGGLLTLDVQSNLNFTVVSDEPWIVQRKSKGLQKSQFLFDIKPNMAELKREGTITVKADQITKKVKVVQKGNPDYAIKVIKELIPFGSKTETQKLVIQTKEDWRLYTDSTWTHVSPRSGGKGEHTIEVQVDPISAVPERVDSIYITAGKSRLNLPIIQKNDDDLMIITRPAHVGGLRDTIISVLLKSSYDVKYQVDQEALEWIVPISSRDMTQTELKFKILKTNSAVERKGKIHFTIGEKKQDFNVTQEGIGLKMILPSTRFDFDSKALDFDITVEANFKHKPWFPDNVHAKYLKSEEISTNEGLTKVKHYFHFDENLSLYTQTFTVTFLNEEFKQFDYKTPFFFKVLQSNSKTINFNKTSFDVSSFGGQIDVEVQSNVKYDMKPDQSWIKLLKETHNDHITNYQFDIAPNQSLEERRGSVVFSFGDSKKYVSIVQEGFSDFGVMVTDSLKPFTSAGSTQDLGFRASDSWTVSSNQSWCTVTPTSGNKGDKIIVKVTAAENKTYDPRKATLTFKCGKHTNTVPVEQGQVDHAEFPQTQYTAAWNQTSLDVTFKANCPYTVAVNQSWVKEVTKSKGLADKKVSFTLEKNTGDHPRDAVLTFTYLDKKQDIKLTQKCMDSLEVVNPVHTVKGGNDTIVKVKVNTTGEVKYTIAENAKKWIIPLETRALLEKEFSFKVLKSPEALDRKGVITFINGNKSATSTITQKGVGLVIEYAKEKQIDNKAQQVELVVNANFQYKTVLDGTGLIQEKPVQTLPSEKEGFVTKKHTFIVPQNTTLDARNFDFTFVNTEYVNELGEDKSHKFRIKQMGTNTIFVAQGNKFTVPVEGKVLELDVSANVKYEVKISDPSWIELLSNTKALDTKKLQFKIHKSLSTKPRTGTITLAGEGCEAVVSVTQEAFDDYGITILEPKLQKFETKGGEQVLKFNSSLDWAASCAEDWCTLNLAKGPAGKNNEIVVKVAPSTAKTDRTAKIVLMAGANHKQIVEVVQRQQDYIEVPAGVQNVGWEKKQVTLAVKSNCDYNVNYTAEWIKTVKQDHNSLVLEVAESNQIDPREAKLTLVYGDIQKDLVIKQAGAPASIEIISGDVHAAWQGAVEEVTVKANCPYEFKSNADWVKAEKSEKGVKLTVSENPDPKGRNTTVTLTYGSLVKNIKVEQNPKSTIEVLSPAEDLIVKPSKGTLVVKVKANLDYKVGFSGTWVKEVSHSATEIVLSYEENPNFEQRNMTVQLSPVTQEGNVESISFKVTQQAQVPQLTVDSESKTIEANVTKVPMGVHSNVEYDVEISTQPEDGKWLTGPTSNTGALELTATENLTLKARTAQVTLKSKTGGIVRKITVTQQAAAIKLDVTPATVSVDSKAHKETVAVTANCNYTVESKEDWVKGTKSEKGDVVTLDIKENYSVESRSAAVTLRYESITKTIIVEQAAGKPVEISVKQPNPIAWNAKEVSVEVTASKAYNVAVKSGNEWLTAPSGAIEPSKPLVLTVKQNNDTNQPRAAIVELTADGLKKPVEFTIIQNAKESEIIVDAEKTMTADAISLDLKVTSNCKYNVAVTAVDNWLTTDTKTGEGESYIHFTATSNPNVEVRTATITITSEDGNITKEVKVIQQGQNPSITIKPEAPILEWNATTLDLAVTANCEYTVSVEPADSWLTTKTTEGKGNGSIQFTATSNPGLSKRTATVTLISKDKQVSLNVDVTQKGQAPSFGEVGTLKEFTAEGGEQKITLNANCKYTVDLGGAEWLKETHTNKELTLTAQAFAKTGSRTATVKLISAEGEPVASFDIQVKQNGQAPSIEVTDGAPTDSIDAKGTTLSLTVKANCEYEGKVVEGDGWITDLKGPTTAEGSDTWTATVAENKDLKGRKGVIKFTDNKGTEKLIDIMQKAAVPAATVPDQDSGSETK